MPFVAAVSDGAKGPGLDNRLLAYRGNAKRVPSVTGSVVPERVRTRAEYRHDILARIYDDLAPYDPEGVLRHEWVNARGAIARMGRGSIEIRVIDSQECATSDVAVVAAVTGAVRFLADGPLAHPGSADGIDMDTLVDVLERCIWQGERAYVDDLGYRAVLGMESRAAPTAKDVWRHLIDVGAGTDPVSEEWQESFEALLEEGPLARRILDALGEASGGAQLRGRLMSVYGRLADCLSRGEVFHAGEV
jgi:hypothetical protein